MSAKWIEKQDFKPEILTELFENHKSFDDSGIFVGFKGIMFENYLTVLNSTLELSKEIAESEKLDLVRKAVFSAGKQNVITKDAVLKAVIDEEKKYLKKPKQNFVIAASISIKYFKELQKVVINRIPITFSRILPKKFDQKPISHQKENLEIEDNPSTYTSVRVSVKARNAQVAIGIAMDSLDLLRGIWNLQINRSSTPMFPDSRRPRSVNKITLGSFHTVHFPNGKLADPNIWYEPDYTRNDFAKTDKWESVNKFEKIVRKNLSKHPYKAKVEDLIIRYVRALDYQNMQVSFIELWGLLEKLTEAPFHPDVVKRAAFLYDQSDLHKQVLHHLRFNRNSSVHNGQRPEQIQSLVFQTKGYVEKLILFHIKNRFKFSNMAEVGAFLHLPSDQKELNKKFKLVQNAKIFRA